MILHIAGVEYMKYVFDKYCIVFCCLFLLIYYYFVLTHIYT